MMNRWTFLIFLVVIFLLITSFIIFVNAGGEVVNDPYEPGNYNGYTLYNPTYYNVIFGLLLAAFVIPIMAFLIYLFYNGMFSFALCR